MPALENRWRFQLPANWEPVGTVCIVFTVPNDPQYVGQIIGLVDALKFSKNFGRDPTRTGAATVSRTWQAALESEPVRIVTCEGGDSEMSTIRMRVKPGVPYISQFSHDEGLTWTDFLIQPHWDSASTTGTEPPINDSRDAMRESDRLIRGVWQWSVDQILSLSAGGVDKATGVNAILGQMAGYVGDTATARAAVNQAWDTMTDLPTPTANEWGSGATDEECCEHYWDWWNRMTDLFQKHPEAATDKLVEMIQDGINNGINEVMNGLGGIAGALGGKIRQFAEEIGNGSAGEERFQECDWLMTWDFLVLAGEGWDAALGDPVLGCPPTHWETGVGWLGASNCTLDDWSEAMIRIKFPATWITNFTVHAEFDNPAGTSIAIDATGEEGTIVSDSDTNQADLSLNPTPGTEWPKQINLSAKALNYGESHITEATASGNGYNPFAPDLTDGSPPW